MTEMNDRKFNIVGVSTQGKIRKFRVANGEIADRVKILERAGCTDIHFIQLPEALGKLEAIEAYKAQFPETAEIRMPNAKVVKPAKTVTVKKTKGNKKTSGDPAAELLRAVEQA